MLGTNSKTGECPTLYEATEAGEFPAGLHRHRPRGSCALLATTPDNLAAGEDIRYMLRSDAVRLGLPDFDFWLFDSRILVRCNWDDANRRMELTTDREQAVRACQGRTRPGTMRCRTRSSAVGFHGVGAAGARPRASRRVPTGSPLVGLVAYVRAEQRDPSAHASDSSVPAVPCADSEPDTPCAGRPPSGSMAPCPY
ncbi:hypothetical protein FBY35_5315 [Streptomyces sp. SLBN-118]|nr:hypothetical protein FBY35_5315 [Streptomyces sp. SLBN-118]